MQNDTGVDVVMTDTARSKEHRYLRQWEIEQKIAHTDEIYRDTDEGKYYVKTTREQHSPKLNHAKEETVVVILAPDDGELVVVTQTSDHYDWGRMERVDELPTTGGDADAQ